MSYRIFHDAGVSELGVHDSADAQWVLLEHIRPSNPGAPRGDQTLNVLDQMQAALLGAGCDFSHVVRTWFFLDDILDWYDEFNIARTAFFEAHGVLEGMVPASTGVGIDGLDAVLTSAVLAVKPRNGHAGVGEVASPLQCPAVQYRSSFSRAVEVRTATGHTLYISGTASIDDEGCTAHVGHVDRQIERTLAVVDALLGSCLMEWAGISRAVAYFPDLRDMPRLLPLLAARGMKPNALRCIEATLCRPDLLFELEVDAFRSAD